MRSAKAQTEPSTPGTEGATCKTGCYSNCMKFGAPTELIRKERLGSTRVLIIGDSMLDRYWFGAVDRISPEAPVPVVRVVREEHRAGGAANVALNARGLGAQVSLLGLVGDDEPARHLDGLMREAGVRSKLRLHPSQRTIVKLRVIGRAQQLIRLDFENSPEPQALRELLQDFDRALPEHDAVIFSDYGKGSLSEISVMIERARAAAIPTFVDPKGYDYSRYAGTSAITPNLSELQAVIGAWAGEADLATRAESLRTLLCVQSLVLTRSEDGMSLFDADGALHVPAQAREVFDVTGAGDTVIAALGTLVGAGLSLREALPVANRAAGIVVGRFGTASVNWEELFATDEASL